MYPGRLPGALMVMIEQLQQLCLAVGNVSEPDARSVVEAVNRRLSDLLNADIVKLYWKEEAQAGVILRPVAFVNKARVPDPQRFQVNRDSPGVLEWVFTEGEPLWVDDIKRNYRDQTIQNRASKRDVQVEALNFADPPQSDAMVVVPIRERGAVCGVYSIELQSSQRLSDRVVFLMQQLGAALGSLLYNVDTYEYDVRKSGRAISRFLDSMEGFQFATVLIDQDWRTAFVARPYAPEFGQVQTAIERALGAFGVRARHYMPDSRQYVVEEIISQIKNAHFCVADLTGNNSNVIAEIGMMMVLGKKPFILKRHRDEASIPFDLSQFNIWDYELGPDDELLVRSASEGRMVPFGGVLEPFLNDLPADTGFHHAAKWDPERQGQQQADDDEPVTAATPPSISAPS
jgi:hypothetical protein